MGYHDYLCTDTDNERCHFKHFRSRSHFVALLGERCGSSPSRDSRVIIHPLQARYLNCDISQEDSMNSTTTTTSLVESPAPSYGTPRRNPKKLTGAEQRALDRQRLKERQQQYHEVVATSFSYSCFNSFFKQEMALGGYFDVFNDPCPEFKPRNFANAETSSESDSMDEQPENLTSGSQEESLNATLTADEEEAGNVATSSQGRVGQGCSTPQCMANHTFAPLRTIDVSVVKCSSESTSSDRLPAAGQTFTCTPVVHAVEQTDKRKAVPSPTSRPLNVERERRSDSMEDVLSKMQKTPKRVSTAAMRSTLNVTSKKANLNVIADVSHEKAAPAMTSSVPEAANVTYSLEKANDTYTVQKDGTYVLEPADARDNSADGTQQNVTFSIEQPEIASVARATGTVSCSEATRSAEPIFAVPSLPVRNTKNAGKITVEQREKRAKTSQKKNASLLEMMDVDVPSPGRTLFAALPSKKQRTLVKTPVRTKPPENEDAMEVSIAMSDISQQPSVESGDDSVVDPQSDPRPSQATPTRAPGFSRRPRNTPDVSLTVSSTPISPDKKKSGQSPFAGLSPKSREEALKKSVERLSQPRKAEGLCCPREWKKQEGKNVVRRVLNSPMVSVARGCNVPAPMTPFQPLGSDDLISTYIRMKHTVFDSFEDCSRMATFNAERSGTVRRGPTSRLRLNGTSDSNLLKRLGDYKPQEKEPVRLPSDGDPTAKEQVVEVADMDPVMPSASPPAGKGASSTASLNIVPDEYEKTLMDAARSLSLEDISPARMDQAHERNTPSETMAGRRQAPQRLLADSLCSTNTPHRDPCAPFKRPIYKSSDYQALESFGGGVGAVSSGM
ncbi:hypothetical protein GCK32_000917 [Trichostrongylus colubriformis]|uniref:Uncharacterized protein n=1 Tax=Trichostrongylus colubriformis TaxID=6319 RepID=A0AAN8ES67_TRICO